MNGIAYAHCKASASTLGMANAICKFNASICAMSRAMKRASYHANVDLFSLILRNLIGEGGKNLCKNDANDRAAAFLFTNAV